MFGALSSLPLGGDVPRLPVGGGGRGGGAGRLVSRCPPVRGCSGLGGGGELLLVGDLEEHSGGGCDWPGVRGCSVGLSDCGDRHATPRIRDRDFIVFSSLKYIS